MTEAAKCGFDQDRGAWANLGQGAPEAGVLPEAPPRVERLEISVDAQEYSPVVGLPELRDAVAELYNYRYRKDKKSKYTRANVAICAGGRLALTRLVSTLGHTNIGHFLPDYTAYEELLESFGRFVPIPILLDSDERYSFSAAQLRREILGRGLSVVLLSNPSNPTGAVLDGETLEGLIGLAEMAGAWLVADEVYRGASQEGDVLPPSIADLYAKGIAVGSMSKAFSLAGLRLGWICASTDLLRAVEVHRDYTTISMGMIDDLLAALALEHSDAILARSRAIVRTNLEILDRWVASEPAITYVKPAAGTTALLRYAPDLPSQEFCLRLLETTGVLFTPGSAFEVEGTVRIGYANNEAVLVEGLRRTSAFLRQLESAG